MAIMQRRFRVMRRLRHDDDDVQVSHGGDAYCMWVWFIMSTLLFSSEYRYMRTKLDTWAGTDKTVTCKRRT